VWFLVGFLLVFIGSLFAIRMAYMLPAGNAVVACNLLKYYSVEIPKLFSVQALGPAYSDGSAVLMNLAEHLGISLVGGTVVLAVGIILNKIKSR